MDLFKDIDMIKIIFMRPKRIFIDRLLVNGLHGYPDDIAEAEKFSVNRFSDCFCAELIRIEEKDVLKQVFYIFVSVPIFWNNLGAFRRVFFDDPVYFIQKIAIVCDISKKTDPRQNRLGKLERIDFLSVKIFRIPVHFFYKKIRRLVV